MDKLNLRIIHTHDTQDNWSKAALFIPEAGEFIVYDDPQSFSRYKIGDGIHTVSELPFITEFELSKLLNVQNNIVVADGGRISEYEMIETN